MKEILCHWRLRFFIFVFSISCTMIVFGENYYVSPGGSDSNSGTINSPWKTLKQGFQTAGPGDTVFVRGGEYPEEQIADKQILNGGAPGNYLVFKAYPGESPVLNDFGRFQLTKEYIRVEGMAFLGMGISASATGCQVVNNTFTGAGFGFGAMHAFGDDLLFEGNTIDVIQNTTLDHGIYVHEGEGIVIRNNTFLRSFGYAIHVFGQNASSTPIPLKNIIIEGNYISGSEMRNGIIVSFAATHVVEIDNITIRNNIITANGAAGMTLRQGKNFFVYNNTIYDNQRALTGSSIGPSIMIPSFSGSEDISDVTISNNIIVTSGEEEHIFVTTTGANIVANNNLYWPQSNGLLGITDSKASFFDPLLVNVAENDFQLSPASPAIDLGITIESVTDDFAGGQRPVGPAYDIGAYEFGSTPTSVGEDDVITPAGFELHQNYPNPFNPGTQITFAIPKQGKVYLAVYNLLGQHIRTLFDQSTAPGIKKVVWDGRNETGSIVPSGIYFYRLESEATVLSKRMFLIK